MNHRLREVQEKAQAAMDMAKESVKETSKIREQMDKDKEVIGKKVEKSEMDIYEEMNLREEKRRNVIIHGMAEPDGIEGRSRMEADKKKIDEIFKIVDVNLTVESDVEFCRRIGEKAERSRPLIVGFYSEWAKSELLRTSKYLADSELSSLSIVPDLTEKQRKAERDMIEEAQRKNQEELTDDDRAKNLVWRVVGKKGQKRMVKMYNTLRGGGTSSRARGGAARGMMTSRGSGNLLPAVQRQEGWQPSTSGRGAEAGGRKRRLSGDGERARKRGAVRGRPPLRGRAAQVWPSQAESMEDDKESQEEMSQQQVVEDEEETAEVLNMTGIRTGEE
jgi:hypothetical protein